MVHTHYNKAFDKPEPSYQLKLEVPIATANGTKMEIVSGNADDVHKNAARTSFSTVPARSNSRSVSICIDVPVFPTRPPFPGYRSAFGYRGGRGCGDV